MKHRDRLLTLGLLVSALVVFAGERNLTAQQTVAPPDEPSLCECCEDACGRRGTLFQWSYGTSFSGGPDLNEPLVTDRPDFTEATVTVGKGVSQIETGYTYIYDNADGESTRTQSFARAQIRN